MSKYDEGLARQYRYEPPSEFPKTSTFSRIVHHRSGPHRYAHAQTSPNWSVGCWFTNLSNRFHCARRCRHPSTRTCVKLPGPCVKTGRIPTHIRITRSAYIYVYTYIYIYTYLYIFQHILVFEDRSTENDHTFNTNIQHYKAGWDSSLIHHV